MNIFKFFPVEYEQLMQMDRKTKEFKKAISKQKSVIIKYLFADFSHNKEDQNAIKYGKKYKAILALMILYMLTAIAVLIYSITLLGDKEIYEFTPVEMKQSIILMSAVVLLFVIAFYHAIECGKILDKYVVHLLDASPKREYSFDKKYLQSVADAPHFTTTDFLKKEDQCVCFFCKHHFNGSEVMVNNGLLFCPKCECNAVLAESSGFLLTEEFIDALNEYWFRKR